MNEANRSISDCIREQLNTHRSLEGAVLYTIVRDQSNNQYNRQFPDLYHAEVQVLIEKNEIHFEERGEYFSAGKWHKSGVYSLVISE